MLSHPAGKQHAADQSFAKGQLGARGVRHAERGPIALRRPDKPSVKQAVCGAAIVKRLAFQFQHGLTDLWYCRCRRERCSEGDGYRVELELRPLPKEAALFETKDAAPKLVQMNGNDRKVCSLDDLFKAAFERQHVPEAIEGAFGEDANHLALFQFLSSAPQGMDNVTGPSRGD